MPMAIRIASELADMGIAVQTLPPGTLDGANDPLASIGKRTNAAAIIRIGRGGVLEVWAANGAAPESMATTSRDGEDRVLAIAAAELIRARLLGDSSSPLPAAAQPSSTGAPGTGPEKSDVAEVLREARPETRDSRTSREIRGARLTAEIGPSVLAGGFSMAPTMNIFIGAALVLAGPLALDLFGFTPFVRAATENDAGRLSVYTALAGGGLRLGWISRSSRFHLYAAPGFSAFFVILRSRAASGFEAHDAMRATAMPSFRAGAALSLSTRMRLDLGLLVGVALSEITVRMGSLDAARFGRPTLAAALNLEVVLW